MASLSQNGRQGHSVDSSRNSSTAQAPAGSVTRLPTEEQQRETAHRVFQEAEAKRRLFEAYQQRRGSREAKEAGEAATQNKKEKYTDSSTHQKRDSLISLKRHLSRSDNDLLQLAFAHDSHSPPIPVDPEAEATHAAEAFRRRSHTEDKDTRERRRESRQQQQPLQHPTTVPDLSPATPEEEETETDEEPESPRSASSPPQAPVTLQSAPTLTRHSSEKGKRPKQNWRQKLQTTYHDLKKRVGTVTLSMSLVNAYHKWMDSPVYMLGNSYDLTRKPIGGGHNHPKGKQGTSEQHRRRIITMIQQQFQNIIWVTYRKEFPPILNSKYTTDAGWGCMLRSGQMMLAQAMILHLLKKDWWRMSGSKRVLVHILRWFLDCAGPKCPYSVHNMLRHGQIYNKPVGEWFGPGSTCYMLNKCHDEHIISDELRMVVGDDGVLYKDKIMAELKRPPRHSDVEQKQQQQQKHSGNQSDKLAGPGPATAAYAAVAGTDAQPLNAQAEEDKDADSNVSFKPLIILIPVRLGVSSINPGYIPSVKRCLEMPQSLGFMGGRLRSSLYFVGYQGSKAFFLDPHTTQTALSVGEYDRKSNSAEVTHSYFCADVRSIELQSIDPSLAFGFYCRNQHEFDSFWKVAQDISRMAHPAFTVADKTPSYEAFDEDDMDFPTVSATGRPPDKGSDKDSKTAAPASARVHGRQSGSSTGSAAAGAAAAAESFVDDDGGDDFVLL